MIIAIVGEQRPFDRLVRSLDVWLSQNPQESIEAQVGGTEFRPSHLRWHRALDMSWLANALDRASLVVTHASLDIVRRSLGARKPVLVLPRHPMFGEDSSDEQLILADRLRLLPGVHVAATEMELVSLLDDPAVRVIPNETATLGFDLKAALASLNQGTIRP